MFKRFNMYPQLCHQPNFLCSTGRQARHGEAGPPQRGKPAAARQAVDVPVAIGRSTSNALSYHTLSYFLIFTSAITDNHKDLIPLSLLFIKPIYITPKNNQNDPKTRIYQKKPPRYSWHSCGWNVNERQILRCDYRCK